MQIDKGNTKARKVSRSPELNTNNFSNDYPNTTEKKKSHYSKGLNFRATELIQNLFPVGRGPSSKT